MKKTILTTIAFLMTASVSWAAPVSIAKVAELTSHRIDRLVALGKIDASFLNRMEKIEVVPVNEAPVAFKVLVSQTQPVQGQALQLGLSFDKDGRPLAFQVVPGGVAGEDPQWTGKDAASLTENALHYVLENAADPKVKMFFDGLTMFNLTKGDLNGAVVARGQVLSSLTTQKLNIYLNLDGTLLSTEIVP